HHRDLHSFPTRRSSDLAIHGTCCEGVRQFSNPSQKKEYLPQMISGKKFAGFSLTEPGAGSDARNLQTTARLEGGQWLVNGTKMRSEEHTSELQSLAYLV